MVAPGKGYNVFAGRDASKALGKSSMKAEDLSADYSELTEWELKVLDDWVAYYTKVRIPGTCSFQYLCLFNAFFVCCLWIRHVWMD